MNAGFSNVGSASRTASVTLRYMPLKQATPSGGTARAAGREEAVELRLDLGQPVDDLRHRAVAGTRATRSLSPCMDVGQVLMGGR